MLAQNPWYSLSLPLASIFTPDERQTTDVLRDPQFVIQQGTHY